MALHGPDIDDDQDRADMLRLASGHDPALNEVMERHGPKLFNYLFRSLQNEEDAADLAQETFARVYQYRDKFDPELKFSTWLYSIASNLVRTKFRHRSRHPEVSLDDVIHSPPDALMLPGSEVFSSVVPNPSESLVTAETSDAVRQAIAALPEELRTPLILSEYEELSHAEISIILKCSPKAVETRIYRARKQLRSALINLLE